MAGQSTGRDLHVNVPLSQVAMRYRPEGMIFDQIAPVVPTKKQSDGYYIWDLDVLRVVDDYRAPGREARSFTRHLSSSTFFCKNYALKLPMTYEDLANADAKEIFASRTAVTEAIIDQLYLNAEYRVAMQCTSGSNVGSYSTVASAWSDTTNSDPIGDIDTGIKVVEELTGVSPNSIIFGKSAWRSIRRHDDVISALFGNSAVGPARVPNLDGIKALFNLERVLVGGTYYNTGAENQSDALSAAWDDVCLIYYAPMQPRIDKPSFMYHFRWNEVPGMNMKAQIFDVPRQGAEEIQCGYYSDEKITAANLAFLITGVNSAQ